MAAREAPTAAPRASYNVDSKVSAFFNARPPETIRLAAPSSGRSDLVKAVFICSVGESETSIGSRDLTSASPPSDSAAENAVDLTVKNLMGIDEEALTVTMALPAYIGRVNVVQLEDVSCAREVMSEIAGTSSLAATRGRIDLAEYERAETTCVKGELSDKIEVKVFPPRGGYIAQKWNA